MNRPPEIIVNSGFVTDENGILTEIVIPDSVTIQNAPLIVTTYATTINWIVSTTGTLKEVNAPNIATLTTSPCSGFTALQKVTMSNLVAITTPNANNAGAFRGCTSLTDVLLPQLKTISEPNSAQSAGTFHSCTSLSSINLPLLQSIIQASTPWNTGTFVGCTGLRSVTLGSVGHAVSGIGSATFSGCTQSGLIITVYTADGLAISGSPWGATNATIVWEEA